MDEAQQSIPSNLYEVALTGAALSFATSGDVSIETALRAASRLHAREDFARRIAARRNELHCLPFDIVCTRGLKAGFPAAALRHSGRTIELLARAEVAREIALEAAAI